MPDTRPMLLTGAAGVLGRWLRPHLVATYGPLRCTDIVDPGPRQEGGTLVTPARPFHVFAAPRRHGAGPIVYASSNPAIGFYTRDDRIDGEVRARPDSYY